MPRAGGKPRNRGWSLTVVPEPRLTTKRYRWGAATSACGHALQQLPQLVEAEGLPQHGPGGALQRVTGLRRDGIPRREHNALLEPLPFGLQVIEQVEPRVRFVQVHIHQESVVARARLGETLGRVGEPADRGHL